VSWVRRLSAFALACSAIVASYFCFQASADACTLVISSNDNLDLELHYTSNANLTELDKPEIGYTILEHLNFHNFVDVPSIAGGFKINRGVVYAKLKLEHKDEIYKFVSLYDVDFVECD
jgi:hypothetical protein